MNNSISKSLLHEIEVLREQKHMSVRDLINGITSERSYRRYVSGGLDAPVDVVFSLTERVNLDFIELLGLVDQHKIIVEALDQLVKFLRYHDIEKAKPFYERLKHEDISRVERKRIVTLFMMRFEMDAQMISSKEYHIYLQESYDFISSKPINCIGSLYIMVLYYESFKDERINEAIMNYIFSEDFLKPSYSIYKQLLIDFLSLNVKDHIVTTHSLESLIKVVDKLSELVYIHEDQDGSMYAHYFYMKLSYLNNDMLTFKRHLLKYTLHSKIRLSESEFRQLVLNLKEEYRMDISKVILENI